MGVDGCADPFSRAPDRIAFIAKALRRGLQFREALQAVDGPWSIDALAAATNISVIIIGVAYRILYYNQTVQETIRSLPDTLAARYVVLTRRMLAFGPNLGEPHTKAFGNGLFELRLKGADGIARVFFCTQVGQRIVMLHAFLKKTNKTPPRERRLAEARMREIQHADSR